MTNKPDWTRFAMWLLFNVFFAFIPLGIVWFFRSILNKAAIEKNNDYPEIMFVAIMICSTALVDIISRKNKEIWNLFFLVSSCVIALGLLTSTAIYGGLRFINVMNAGELVQSQSLNIAIVFTMFFAFLGIINEVLITYSDVLPANQSGS